MTRLDPSLWRDLGEADSGRFAEAWLQLQAQNLGDVSEAVLLLRGERDHLDVAAVLPAGQAVSDGLRGTAEVAIAQGKGVARRRAGRLEVGYPLRFEDEVVAVMALARPAERDPDATLRALRWGGGWIQAWTAERARLGTAPGLRRARAVFRLLAVALGEGGFKGAARRVVTELARLADCDRVSVGFRRRGQAHVAAVSHSAHFGKRMNLIRLLANSMDEAIDQQATILYPAPEDAAPLGDRAHEQLARAAAAGQLLTIPLLIGDRFEGAFTFERPPGRPFDQATVDLVNAVTELAGPVLDERRRNDRWLLFKAIDSAAGAARAVLGPGHLRLKLALVAVVILTLAGWVAHGPYRISGDVALEGQVQRTLAAPFDGFIAEAPLTAGDRAAAGDLVVALDDRDLTLERLDWIAERQRHRFEYEEALGTRDRVMLNIARAQIEQAEAQIERLDERISRAKIRAPFSGLIVAGDLSQSIGAAVTRGETLFQLAPLDAYRLTLWVSDTQIDEVRIGQVGNVILAALPTEPVPITVTKITPVAEVREGQNVFRVEARLEEISDRLRPGMQGVGKIDVDERRLVWIWTRSFVEWLDILAWRWFG